jgi:hypothetical protein
MCDCCCLQSLGPASCTEFVELFPIRTCCLLIMADLPNRGISGAVDTLTEMKTYNLDSYPVLWDRRHSMWRLWWYDAIFYGIMASCKGKDVPVLSFNWTPYNEGVLGDWRYNSTHYWPRHLMKVSSQLHAPAPFHQEKSRPWYPLDRKLGGPQSRSGRGGDEKNSQRLPWLEHPTIQPIAQRYTTEISRLLSWHQCLYYWGSTGLTLESSLIFKLIHRLRLCVCFFAFFV